MACLVFCGTQEQVYTIFLFILKGSEKVCWKIWVGKSWNTRDLSFHDRNASSDILMATVLRDFHSIQSGFEYLAMTGWESYCIFILEPILWLSSASLD